MSPRGDKAGWPGLGGVLGITMPPHVARQVRDDGGGSGCGNGEGAAASSVSPQCHRGVTGHPWSPWRCGDRSQSHKDGTGPLSWEDSSDPPQPRAVGVPKTGLERGQVRVPPLCHPGDVTEPERGHCGVHKMSLRMGTARGSQNVPKAGDSGGSQNVPKARDTAGVSKCPQSWGQHGSHKMSLGIGTV